MDTLGVSSDKFTSTRGRMLQWPYYVAIAICLLLSVTTIMTFRSILPKDSAENTKLLAILIVFSFVSSLTAYALALYHFASRPDYMIQFILLIVMVVVLPAALISSGVSTLAVSNLRDAVAAGTA